MDAFLGYKVLVVNGMNWLVFYFVRGSRNNKPTSCFVCGKVTRLLLIVSKIYVLGLHFEFNRFGLFTRVFNRSKQHVVSRSVSLNQCKHVFVNSEAAVSFVIHILVSGLVLLNFSFPLNPLFFLLSSKYFRICVAHLLELLLPSTFLVT